MSSDYIPRLRQELLRAGASTQPRWRPARTARALRPLAAAAAVVLAAVALVAVWPDERAVEPAGPVQARYRVDPPAAADQTAEVMRARLAAAGVDGASVSVSGATLTIAAPTAVTTTLAQPGRVAFYDWEASVLGPDGAPAPGGEGVDPGRQGSVSRAEAEARGGRVVRAEDGSGWFALGGEPALTNAHIAGAQSFVLDATQHPLVLLELTEAGQAAFADLTRELAHRGRAMADRGRDDLEATQHLAIVVDDRIVAVPFVDFRMAPNGLDGADGAQISGNLTAQSARELAAVLDSGPLPGELTPE